MASERPGGGEGRPHQGEFADRVRPEGLASGPGALCAEAQADGVPCTELGRDCQVCEKAVRQERRSDSMP